MLVWDATSTHISVFVAQQLLHLLSVDYSGTRNSARKMFRTLPWVKELRIFNPFATRCRKPWYFKHCIWINIKSFKYERFTPLGCKKYRNKKNWVCIKNSVYFLILILIDIERWFDIYQSDKFSIDKSENTAHDDFSIVL